MQEENEEYIPSPQNLEVSWDIITDAKQKMYEARDAVRVAEAELWQIREAACASIENDGMQMHIVTVDGRVAKIITTMDEFDAYMAC
ncbi:MULTISPECIES: hypothetical protein [Thalassospira]|nr:hypothetical protein [Thalassospira sp. GB04J01]UKV14548.1 hypothetical protein L6172_21300 [Thalassospiraceae bacterium SW-3-3]